MLSHGYLPKQMLVSVIVPVVKNKNSSLSSKNYYRPVALSSVISKVFEKLLLSRLKLILRLVKISLDLSRVMGLNYVY